MIAPDWNKYLASSGPHKQEIERGLVKQGVLSTEEGCNWTIFSRRDFMLFNPAIKDFIGLFFTAENYAVEYATMKYQKSHKQVTIYRFCDNDHSWRCVCCHVKQIFKVFMRVLVKK
jgi:hypothetical protein